MEIKKRIKSLLFILLGFFVFNILRIIILSVLFVNKIKYFEELHLFLWFFLSTLFVILIWFLSVKLFKIKGTPFYSDLRYLYNKSILNSRKIK
jgi:energy-coupling factor transporter transmembrane protein EcfT